MFLRPFLYWISLTTMCNDQRVIEIRKLKQHMDIIGLGKMLGKNTRYEQIYL